MAALKPWLKRLLLIALWMGLCLGNALAAPNETSFTPDRPLSLQGLWKFKTGGEKIWADPSFDDQSWKKINVPGYWDDQGFRGYKGEAWYRTRFNLKMAPYERTIGLYLGGINDTDQVFLNGRIIGQTGQFAPLPQTMYGRVRLYLVPPKLVRFRGENQLAIRIWHAPLANHDVGGFASSGISLCDYEKSWKKGFFQDLWQLNISILILFIGFFHLPFYLRRRQAKEYLFFCLLCLCVGVYGLMRSQLRFQVSNDFLLMKQFEYLSLFLAPSCGVEYARRLFERKRPLFVALLEGASVLFALIAAVSWNLSLNTTLLVPFYLMAIILVLYMLVLLVMESSKRNPEAKIVSLGVGIFLLAGINDMLVTQGIYRLDFDWLNSLDLTASSFLAVIVCMGLSLSTRFLRTHQDLESNRERLMRKERQLFSILKISQEMSAILNLDRLAEKLISIALELTNAHKGLILVWKKKAEAFDVLISKNLTEGEGEEISGKFGKELFEGGEVIADGAGESILALPIKFQGEVKGACYLEKSTPFNEEDIAVLKSVMNQAAISSENAKLYELATTDGLTKLIGHRHFQFLLQQETERAIRFHRTLALLMLDIDHFKRLNDTYGHQAGDEVLIEVSRVLQQGCREIDTVARYGGEEFVLILPETDLAGAFLVAERLRSRVENCVICYQDQVMRVTVSLGVACFPEQAASKEELIQVADKAMYLSKERGRNRVSPPIFLK